MNKLSNAAARRYLRQVRRLLPCSSRDKKQLTGAISSNLTDYLAEYPDAGYEAIAARFGAPESVAAMCLENTEVPVLLQKLQIRKRIVTAVFAVAAAILLTWSGVLLYTIIRVQREALGGYCVEEVIEKETEAPMSSPVLDVAGSH